MNTYTWFKIFNKTEFEATGLVSRSYRVFLNGVGERTILATKPTISQCSLTTCSCLSTEL
jgi:hypothetical protein